MGGMSEFSSHNTLNLIGDCQVPAGGGKSPNFRRDPPISGDITHNALAVGPWGKL